MDDGEDLELEAVVEARRRLEARHAAGLHALLTDRDDLRGVYALADLVRERVLWCA